MSISYICELCAASNECGIYNVVNLCYIVGIGIFNYLSLSLFLNCDQRVMLIIEISFMCGWIDHL